MPVVDLSAYKPVPATLGDANQIANGFQAVQTALNGLDNLNFAAGKIFDPLKIMQNAAVAGQGLVWDTTANGGTGGWVPGGTAPKAVYVKTSTTDIVNTTTESDLLAGAVTIPGGTLTNGRVLRLSLAGDYLNNTGGNQAIRLLVRLGGTAGVIIFDSNNATWTLAAGAVRRPLTIQLLIAIVASGSTNNVLMEGFVAMGSNIGATVGIGRISDAVEITSGVQGTTQQMIGPLGVDTPRSVDMSVSQVLAVDVIHGAANASLSARCVGAVAEIN